VRTPPRCYADKGFQRGGKVEGRKGIIKRRKILGSTIQLQVMYSSVEIDVVDMIEWVRGHTYIHQKSRLILSHTEAMSRI
jgi:hypothetical protein